MPTTLEDLFDNNQKTSALGWYPNLGATQGAPMDKTISAVAALANFQSFEDARVIAFSRAVPDGLGQWPRMSESTGIHAEMMIVRAWLIKQMSHPTSASLQDALASLEGRTIHASQPACWYCHAFMTAHGIRIGNNVLGKKPLTGWRNPVTGKMIANADMPSSSTAVEF